METVEKYKAARRSAINSRETLLSITPLAVLGAYEAIEEKGLVKLEKLRDPKARQAFTDAVRKGVLGSIGDYYQVEGFVDDVRARHAMWGALGYVPEQIMGIVEGLKDNFVYDAFIENIEKGTRYPEATALDATMPISALSLDKAGDVVNYAASKGLRIDPSKLTTLSELEKAILIADQADSLTTKLEK